MRKLRTTDEFVVKHLVILYSPRKHEVGLLIQEGDNVQEGYWDDIYPLSKEREDALSGITKEILE